MAAVLRVVERHGRGMACVLVSFKCFVRSRFGRGSWPQPGARRISDAAVALLGETVFLPSACSERGGGQSRMLGTRNIAISAISNGRFYSPRYLDPIYYHRFFSCAVDDRNRMDNSRAARAHVSHQRAKASNTTSTIGSTTTRPVSGLRPVYDKCFSFHFRSELAIRVTLRSFETSHGSRDHVIVNAPRAYTSYIWSRSSAR